MNWKTFSLDDFEGIAGTVENSFYMGSDTSLGNLYFLQEKYDIKMNVSMGFLFRYYSGESISRRGYGYPILMEGDYSPEKLKDALILIFADSKETNRPVKFILLSEKQKAELDECLKKFFPEKSADWQTERNDSDYLYLRQSLAELKGKTYHKKKNHVSKFLKTYSGRWEFRSLGICAVEEDIKKVSWQWLMERGEQDVKVLAMEHKSIEMAVEAARNFKMTGGVLYIDGNPVAMTLASPVSSTVLDVHYEKCLGEAAAYGGYAAINWCMANNAVDFEYLNREEDMGIEGLRKAKLSYHPDIILDKWFGEIK